MGIVAKPFTFTAGATKSGEAAQVNADYDAIYTEFNGNITDANIHPAAAISQSKIANLTADLAQNGLRLIQTQDAANSASIDFTAGLTSTYNFYVVQINNLIPATNSTDLWLRVSQSATFLSGASDYIYSRYGFESGPSDANFSSGGDTKINLANALSNNATQPLSLELRIVNPANATAVKPCFWQAAWVVATTAQSHGTVGSGLLQLNGLAIDGIRFLMSSGNITSGTFALYGVKKS